MGDLVRPSQLETEAREAHARLRPRPLANTDTDAWDPRTTDRRPSAVFREFGRLRWLLVPIGAVVFALVVFLVGVIVGLEAGA